MLFSTCFSRYAIDVFAVRDFPQKRILISIADYDEESWGIETPTPGIIFTHHFTDNLQGDYSEAFGFTFVQVFLGFITLIHYYLFNLHDILKSILLLAFAGMGGLLGMFLAGIQLGIMAGDFAYISGLINNIYVHTNMHIHLPDMDYFSDFSIRQHHLYIIMNMQWGWKYEIPHFDYYFTGDNHYFYSRIYFDSAIRWFGRFNNIILFYSNSNFNKI